MRGVGKKTGWEVEVQEKLDVTLQSDQRRRPAQWLSPWDAWPPTACPELPAHLAGCPDLCWHPRAMAGPPASPWLPAVPKKGKLHHEAQSWPLAHGGAGKRCSPGHSGEVLVYNIKTSLTLTFLWTKAFTLETPSVFLPIIMITEHVIPLLLFFLPSFDLSSRSCFLCSPGHCAPPSPGHLWETHTGTHGLYCRASLKARKKNKIKKSQV